MMPAEEFGRKLLTETTNQELKLSNKKMERMNESGNLKNVTNDTDHLRCAKISASRIRLTSGTKTINKTLTPKTNVIGTTKK